MKSLSFIAALSVLLLAPAASAQWDIQTVDNSGDVGYYSNIDYDSQGYPHIIYVISGSASLGYAHWTGTTWQIERIQLGNAPYNWISIAVDDFDKPHITYGLYYDGCTKLFHSVRSDSGWQPTGITCNAGNGYKSIALYFNETTQEVEPHIAFSNPFAQDLGHAWYNSATQQWIVEYPDTGENVGGWPSIALDSAGRVYISYYFWDGVNAALKLAIKDIDGSWGTLFVDEEGYVGSYSSIAIGADNSIHITYLDAGNMDLKYATLPGSLLRFNQGGNSAAGTEVQGR